MNKIDEYKLERIIELIRLSKKPGFITNYIKDCNMLEDQRLSMHPDSENLFKLRDCKWYQALMSYMILSPIKLDWVRFLGFLNIY